MQSATSSRPANRAVTASSAIRHRYNYRDNTDAEDGNKEFVASPPDEKYDEDISDAKFVEKPNSKIKRRRVGAAMGRGSATPESSTKRKSVIFSNKN